MQIKPRDHTSASLAYRIALDTAALPKPEFLTQQAFQLRLQNRYAHHPVEATLRHFCADAKIGSGQGYPGYDFESAETIYRAGAQGLRLPQIPELPEKAHHLSRLSVLDRAGRRALRRWVETHGPIIDDHAFQTNWEQQGKRGGAEHHVYHDENQGRWFKRLYYGVNFATLVLLC